MDNQPFDNQHAPATPPFPENRHHGYQVGNAAVQHAQQPDPPRPSLVPQPVVKVLSPRGVEYVFLTISLITGAISLIGVLLALVNDKLGFEAMAAPTSALVVAVPVFAWLFLRLKNAELRNPALAFDASKRRSTQFIQIAAFVTCFFTLIGLISSIFAKAGGYSGSMVKLILDALVVLVVAGGILAYYWVDEHKAN